MSRIDKLTRTQQAAARLAREALESFWQANQHRTPYDFEQLLMQVLPALADRFGNVAAVAAADWYEDTRAAMVGGSFTAPVARANLEAAAGSARWLAHTGADPRGSFGRAAASLDRHVKNAGRDTIAAAMRADPTRPRWARVMRGRETCGWCRMLASRGFVYESAQSAGGEAGSHGWGHDECDCEPIPEWTLNGAERAIYDREIEDLYQQYLDVRSRLTASPDGYITDEQIAEEWRRSLIDYDIVREQLERQRTGMTLDKSLHQNAWDDHRRNLVDLLEGDYPDGYVGTKKLIPRHPAQAPADWPEDLPILRAREWNHALYGDNKSGGHLPGYGWVNSRPEFPADANPAWVQAAAEHVLRKGTATGLRFEGIYQGTRVAVTIATRRGVTRVTSIFPIV